jgi:hypothetical protein
MARLAEALAKAGLERGPAEPEHREAWIGLERCEGWTPGLEGPSSDRL